MKRATAALTLATASLFAATAIAADGSIFEAKCAACHPDGGNIMKKGKTLHKKDLEANKLKTTADLVKYMRAPGPGMPTFDSKTLPDKEAGEVAKYILKAFK